MPNVFEAAKTISALDAAEKYIGVQPKRTGKNIKCRCPWHNDKTPSLVFFDDGMFKCFGCQAKGTSIDVVMLTFGIDVRSAAIRICNDFGVKYDQVEGPSKQQTAARSKKAIREDATVFETEVCAWERTLDKIIDIMEADERYAVDFSERFKRAVNERNAIKALSNQLLEIFAKDDMDAAAALMSAYNDQRKKWVELVRYWSNRGLSK